MKKKILSISMVTACLFAMAACGNNSSPTNNTSSDQNNAVRTEQSPTHQKDTTSISIGKNGASVKSGKANVNVGKNGASVETKDVKVKVDDKHGK